MTDPSTRMIALKGKINHMLDDLVKVVPGTNAIEVTLALVAVAGTSIRPMPGEAKQQVFGAALAILGQEAGVRTMAVRANKTQDDIADFLKRPE
jgi:hypothetical protein